MSLGAAWQDWVALLAALLSGAWLFRRWLLKRRTRAGCDQCAASLHARMGQAPRPEGTHAKSSPR